jgi:membrane associated rhomboid family serine protease
VVVNPWVGEDPACPVLPPHRTVMGGVGLVPWGADGSELIAVYRCRPPGRWGPWRRLWEWSVRRQAELLGELLAAEVEPVGRPVLPPGVERTLQEAAEASWKANNLPVGKPIVFWLAALGAAAASLAVGVQLWFYPEADGALVGAAGLLAGMLAAAVVAAGWWAYWLRRVFLAFEAGRPAPGSLKPGLLVRRLPLLPAGGLAVAAAFGWAAGWVATTVPQAGEEVWNLFGVAVMIAGPVVAAMAYGDRIARREQVRS